MSAFISQNNCISLNYKSLCLNISYFGLIDRQILIVIILRILLEGIQSFGRTSRRHDLSGSCKIIYRDATMDPQVASRRRLVTRDDNDGDAKDACGRGLIKEGQAGGTIRSS